MGRFANLVDDAIFAVAPGSGAKRKATRRRYELSARIGAKLEARFSSGDGGARHYGDMDSESAQHDRFRGSNWMASRSLAIANPNWTWRPSAMRCREMYRDDLNANGAIETRVNQIVGLGIRLQPRIFEVAGLLTAAQAGTLNGQLEQIRNRWETCCGIDGLSLWLIQRQVQRNWDQDGEIFVHLVDVDDAGRPIPLAIELIDAERVETPPEKMGDPYCRMGIQHEPGVNGRVLGYWVRQSNPGDTPHVRLHAQVHSARRGWPAALPTRRRAIVPRPKSRLPLVGASAGQAQRRQGSRRSTNDLGPRGRLL